MDSSVVGAILGCAVGVAGGVIGTYFSIKNTSGPKERSFMIKCSAVAWIAILAFVALMIAVPAPYKWFLWLPYGVVLPIAIIRFNKTQVRLRAEEGAKGGGQTFL